MPGSSQSSKDGTQRDAHQPYEVGPIRQVDPPPGTEGPGWHKYVIAQGGVSVVKGFRQGTLPTVRFALDEIVAQMNERRKGRRGTVSVSPKPKPKPKK